MITKLNNISKNEKAFRRGRELFRLGIKIPKPYHDNDPIWNETKKKNYEKCCLWFGYMMERSKQILKDEKIKNYIENGYDLD